MVGLCLIECCLSEGGSLWRYSSIDKVNKWIPNGDYSCGSIFTCCVCTVTFCCSFLIASYSFTNLLSARCVSPIRQRCSGTEICSSAHHNSVSSHQIVIAFAMSVFLSSSFPKPRQWYPHHHHLSTTTPSEITSHDLNARASIPRASWYLWPAENYCSASVRKWRFCLLSWEFTLTWAVRCFGTWPHFWLCLWIKFSAWS